MSRAIVRIVEASAIEGPSTDSLDGVSVSPIVGSPVYEMIFRALGLGLLRLDDQIFRGPSANLVHWFG